MLCAAAFVALCVALKTWWLLLVPLSYFLWAMLARTRQGPVDAFDCRPADPVRHRLLLVQVANAAQHMGVPTPAVYVSPLPIANAASFADLRGGSVFFFQHTIDTFPDDEMFAMVAHEVAHLKNRDTAFSAFLGAVQSAFTHVLAVVCFVFGLATAMALAMISRTAGRASGSIITGLTTAITALGFWLTKLLVLAGGRSREHMADRVAADILPDPLALGRALARMEATERRWKVGELSPAVAAHCTVQPFVPGVAARMLSSHPSTTSRVRRLERLVGPTAAAESQAVAARLEQARLESARQMVVDEARHRQPGPFTRRPPFDPVRGELLWGAFPGQIVKSRKQQGRSFMEAQAGGTVYVTTHRVVFYGDVRTEWRWDKVHEYGWERGVLGGDAVIFAVTNRQAPSGLIFAPGSAPGARRLMSLARAVAEGRREAYVADLGARATI